jgi:hypothetical protein
VVVGTVKRRAEARRIYEAAREQGYVASLLEQERSNIFTQSVANIPPGAEVVVEISYVELLEPVEGLYAFEFPMVVGPRYIPGRPTGSPAIVPAEISPRDGVILLGPASLTLGAPGQVDELGPLQAGRLRALLEAARPIDPPDARWWGQGEHATAPVVWYPFEATYGDGARESGWIHVDGTGQINGRWFFTDPDRAAGMGGGFARDTNEVPDASRITPMPVRPPTRAGHDISVSVTIDTGGPALTWVDAPLHEIAGVQDLGGDIARDRLTVELAGGREIPNRDFVLRWRQADERIETARFAHTGPDGNFFTLMLQPPARVVPEHVPPRELIFVLDTSGSMSGFPIEKAKAVMTRAIDAMRGADTFNVITFAGHTSILWDAPRPATEANRAEARAFVESRQGGGGTEMMKAIDAALRPTGPARAAALAPAQLVDLPADGRAVVVRVNAGAMEVLEQDGAAPGLVELPVRDDLAVRARIAEWPLRGGPIVPGANDGRTILMRGRWVTADGRRLLDVATASDEPVGAGAPMRIVMFLTDGFVGNDEAIVAAVREHAGTTRVFSFGVGNSVNRALLDGMAKAGRGTVEYVLLADGADEAVGRFTRRIETPVLTDIEIVTSDGLRLTDTIPSLDAVPDLFDDRPLVIHGRYAEAGRGTLTVRGRTGAGRWERVVAMEFPAEAPEHDVIAALWARARVDQLSVNDDVEAIVAIGEQFQIMTKHTSFVAVEHSRVVVEGRPLLVQVPIELPDGVSWEGIFGDTAGAEQLGGAVALYGFGSEPDDAAVLGLQATWFGRQATTRGVMGTIRQETTAVAGYKLGRPATGPRPDTTLWLTAGKPAAPPPAPEPTTATTLFYANAPQRSATVDGKSVPMLGDIPVVGHMFESGGVHLAYTQEPFVGVLEGLQQSTGVPIQVDWSGLQCIGVTGQEPISIGPITADVPTVLPEILGQVGVVGQQPQWTIRDGVVVVSDPATLAGSLVRVYDVRDLVTLPAAALDEAGVPAADGAGEQRLAAHVRERIDPAGWAAVGGSGTVTAQPGALVITTSADGHAAIEALLGALRAAPAVEQAIETRRQAWRLVRVLDGPLQQLVEHPGKNVPGAVTVGDELLVSILVADASPETLAALRGAGVTPCDVVEPIGHVVGTVGRGRIRELGLLEAVRRVELVRRPAARGGSRPSDRPAD